MFRTAPPPTAQGSAHYGNWTPFNHGSPGYRRSRPDLYTIDALQRRHSRGADQAADDGAGISELVLSRDCPSQFTLLLPMLAHLSRQAGNRWITWIAPTGIDRQTLEHYGVDTGKIRLVYPHKHDDILWITWEALVTGNSHTVIATPGKLSNKNFSLLQKAALQGSSQGLLLRMR